jgi:hypothetical protein
MKTSKGLRQKGSFIAKDSQGHSRRLYIWAHIIDVGDILEPDAFIEGMIEIKTESGRSVSLIKKGQYEIVGTGEMLTSDDPEALG